MNNSFKTTQCPKIKLLYLLFFAISFLIVVQKEFFTFPNGYQINELMISYQGGFIRRGLTGEILFILNEWIPVNIIVPIVFFTLLIIIANTLFNRINALNVGAYYKIALLFSPGLLCFCLQDVTCLRREIICYLGIICCLELFKSHYSFNTKIVVAAVISTVALLIYESFIVWVPLIYIGLRQEEISKSKAIDCINTTSTDPTKAVIKARRLSFWHKSLLFLVVCAIVTCLIILSQTTKEQAFQIVSAWQDYYSSVKIEKFNPFSYIGISQQDYYDGFKFFWSVPRYTKYLLLGLLLTFLPFLIIFNKYKAQLSIPFHPAVIGFVVMLPVVLLGPLGYDLGRWIHFSGMSAIFVLCYFTKFQNQPNNQYPLNNSWLSWCLLIYYLLGWHMTEIGNIIKLWRYF